MKKDLVDLEVVKPVETLDNIMFKNYDFPGVYVIKAVNKDIYYVGSANNIKNRLKRHLKDLRTDVHHTTYFQNYYNKYGLESLYLFDTLKCSLEDLADEEQLTIDYYDHYYTIFNGTNVVTRCSKESDINRVIEKLKSIIMTNGKNKFTNIMNIKALLRHDVKQKDIINTLKVHSNIVQGVIKNQWAVLSSKIVDSYMEENTKQIESLLNKIKYKVEVKKKIQRKSKITITQHSKDLLVLHKMSCIYFDTNEKLFFNNRYLTKVQFNRILMKNYNIDRFKLAKLRSKVTYQNLPNTIDELTALLSSQEIFNDLLKPFENFDKEVMYTDVKVSLTFEELMSIKYLYFIGKDDLTIMSQILNVKYLDINSSLKQNCTYVDQAMVDRFYTANTKYIETLLQNYTELELTKAKSSRLSVERKSQIDKYIELEKVNIHFSEFNKLGYTKQIRREIRKTVYYQNHK